MIGELTKSQRALAHFMSELSEEAYCAGWMDGLEYALWHAVATGPREYGRLKITEDHIDRLKSLSSKCRGWILFDEKKEETFVSLEEWTRIYHQNIAARLTDGSS